MNEGYISFEIIKSRNYLRKIYYYSKTVFEIKSIRFRGGPSDSSITTHY